MFNIASTVNVPTSNSLHDPWSMGPRCQKLRVGTWQGAHPSAVHKWTEDAEEVEGIEVEVAHEERSCGIICICLCLLLISFVGLSYFSQHVHWSVLQNIELGICMFYWMCFWYFKAIFSGLFQTPVDALRVLQENSIQVYDMMVSPVSCFVVLLFLMSADL